MTITYVSADQAPPYIDVLFDGNGTRFERDNESLAEVWSCGEEYGIPTEAVFRGFHELHPACISCERVPAESLCCSSHQHELCHRCYRRTHFVEVCVEGCSKCAAEGLAVRLSESSQSEGRS